MYFKNKYFNSITKHLFDYSFAFLIFLLIFIPALLIYLLFKVFFKSEIIFRQTRVGKDGKRFTIYKFRTMKINAESEKHKYLKLNEANGPVFKIKNDPRFTNFGKYLSYTGLDELPQIINVLKGEMSIVGPRPLPDHEYLKLRKKYRTRNFVKPGITSLWVVSGSHRLSFEKWMSLDMEYIKGANLLLDLKIILETILIPLKTVIGFFFK